MNFRIGTNLILTIGIVSAAAFAANLDVAPSNASAICKPEVPDWSLNIEGAPFLRGLTCEDKLILRVTGLCQEMPLQGGFFVEYRGELLVRGDTVYSKSYRTAEFEDFETCVVLQGKQKISLERTSGGISENSILIDLKNHPFGVCYLTAKLLNEQGQTLAQSGRIRYDVRMKVPPILPHDEIVGTDIFGNRYVWGSRRPDMGSVPAINTGKEYIRRYGFNWVQLYTGWEYSANISDDFKEMEYLDKWADVLRDGGNQRVMCWIANDGPNRLKDADLSMFSESFTAWVSELMERYGDIVEVWNVWNEPDSKPHVRNTGFDIEGLKIAYDLKQKYCPQSKIILSVHTKSGLNYLKDILEKDAGQYLDGVGIHPYRRNAPEILESDGYLGNSTGQSDFIGELQETYQLLVAYNVKPDIYITEMNYNINYIQDLDDNDAVNMMMRMHILARTVPYVKTFLTHALDVSRMVSVAHPCLVAHLAGTEFVNRIDTKDDQICGYAFRKANGQVIMPVWAVEYPKVVKISGISGVPLATDIFGNTVQLGYDIEDRCINNLKIGQSVIYLTLPSNSKPTIEIQNYLAVTNPSSTYQGGGFDVDVQVKKIPSDWAKVIVQAKSNWSVTPTFLKVSQPSDISFHVSVAPNDLPVQYPITVEMQDSKGQTVDMVTSTINVQLPLNKYNEKYGFTLVDDFESGSLNSWLFKKSEQYEIDLEQEDENSVLKMAQKHIDYAASIENKFAPVHYGAFEFEFKPSKYNQTFEIQLSKIRMVLDGKGQLCLLNENGESQNLGSYLFNTWQKIQIFFDAPQGLCRLWKDKQFIGQFNIPMGTDGYAQLKFTSGMLATPEPAVFLLDNIKVVNFKPNLWGDGQPLKWSVCGPFPNKVDLETKKRPFELGIDYLKQIGGEQQLSPYPGLVVPLDSQSVRMFTPFYNSASDKKFNGKFDFFDIQELGLTRGQADILCYAVCYIVCDSPRQVTIGLGSDDYCQAWLNHEILGRVCGWPVGRSATPDSEIYNVMLQKGLNTLMLKVDQGEHGYMFYATIRDRTDSMKERPCLTK